jgi:hypothetical protein
MPFAALLPRRVKPRLRVFGPTCLLAGAPHQPFFAEGRPECLSATTRRMRRAGQVAMEQPDGLLGLAPVCGPCRTVSPRWTTSALGLSSCRVVDISTDVSELTPGPTVPGHRFRRRSAHGFSPASPRRTATINAANDSATAPLRAQPAPLQRFDETDALSIRSARGAFGSTPCLRFRTVRIRRV